MNKIFKGTVGLIIEMNLQGNNNAMISDIATELSNFTNPVAEVEVKFENEDTIIILPATINEDLIIFETTNSIFTQVGTYIFQLKITDDNNKKIFGHPISFDCIEQFTEIE